MDKARQMNIDDFIRLDRQGAFDDYSGVNAHRVYILEHYDWTRHSKRVSVAYDIGRPGELGASPEIEIPDHLVGSQTGQHQVGAIHPRTVKRMETIRRLLTETPGMSAQELSDAMNVRRQLITELMRNRMPEIVGKPARVLSASGRGTAGMRYYIE